MKWTRTATFLCSKYTPKKGAQFSLNLELGDQAQSKWDEGLEKAGQRLSDQLQAWGRRHGKPDPHEAGGRAQGQAPARPLWPGTLLRHCVPPHTSSLSTGHEAPWAKAKQGCKGHQAQLPGTSLVHSGEKFKSVHMETKPTTQRKAPAGWGGVSCFWHTPCHP